MITTKIVFDHRGRAGDENEGAVEVRVTVGRKSYYIATGKRCMASQFYNGEVRNRKTSDADNQRINIVRERVERIVNDMLSSGAGIDAAEIRRRVTQADETEDNGGKAFLDWCEDQIAELNISAGTRKHYFTMLRRLREFGRITAWQDITVENIYGFDAWLHDRERCGASIGDAAVWNYHKNLKVLLGRALLFDKITSNPYDRLRGKFKRGNKENTEYLTEEEMSRFCSLNVSEGLLAKAKDLFVIQMYTGLAYSDALRFDMSRYKQVDGRWVSVGERVKTGVAYISELLPPVVEVLERNNWKVPRLDNADYNHALKILGQAAGISTPLHSHLARHTFATWMLRNGAKIENVSRMLGHTNVSQTMRYAKTLAQSVHEDFEKVLCKFGKI